MKDDKLIEEIIKSNIEITPLVMDEFPDAKNVWFKVGCQSFCVTPEGVEDADQAEFIQKQLAIALDKLIKSEQSLSSIKASVEAETIENIMKFFKDTADATPLGHEHRGHGASTYNWNMQSYNDVKNMPRKYQPTE